MSKDYITFKPKRWIFQIQLYCKIFLLLIISIWLFHLGIGTIQNPNPVPKEYGALALLCCVIYYWRITNLRILLQYYNLHKNCQLIIDKEKNKIIYIRPEQTIEFSEDNIASLTITYCETQITNKYYYEIYLKGEESPIILTSMLCKKLEKHLNLVYNTDFKTNMLIHKKIRKEYTQVHREDIDNKQLNTREPNASDIVFNADKKYYRKMIFRNIAAILTTNIIIACTAHKYTDYRMVITSYILLNSIFIISLVTIIKEYSINKRDSLIIHKDSNKFTYCTENRKIEFTQEDIISFKYFRNHIKYDYYEIHIKQCESPIVITSLFCKDLNKYISKKYELIRKKNFINVPRNKNQS